MGAQHERRGHLTGGIRWALGPGDILIVRVKGTTVTAARTRYA
jgi:hypothetical protein